MSLYGYRKKGKPAPWTQVPGAKIPTPPKIRLGRAPAPRKAVPRAKGIARQSKATRKRLALYQQQAIAWLAQPGHQHCAVCGKRGTANNPLHVHHARGRVGALLTDARFWWPVHDQPCHAWIHANPQAARERGLLAAPGEWGRQN